MANNFSGSSPPVLLIATIGAVVGVGVGVSVAFALVGVGEEDFSVTVGVLVGLRVFVGAFSTPTSDLIRGG
jgi:hypothetical protein